jgi:hypothetical protein
MMIFEPPPKPVSHFLSFFVFLEEAQGYAYRKIVDQEHSRMVQDLAADQVRCQRGRVRHV